MPPTCSLMFLCAYPRYICQAFEGAFRGCLYAGFAKICQLRTFSQGHPLPASVSSRRGTALARVGSTSFSGARTAATVRRRRTHLARHWPRPAAASAAHCPRRTGSWMTRRSRPRASGTSCTRARRVTSTNGRCCLATTPTGTSGPPARRRPHGGLVLAPPLRPPRPNGELASRPSLSE